MYIYIFCGLIYVIVCNWIQIVYLLKNLLWPKRKIITIDNKALISKYKKKTNLTLTIRVMKEERLMIGFMISNPPFKPMMIFSTKLYNTFNDDEKEWVILHEACHYLMWHNCKLALTQLFVFIFGLSVVNFFRLAATAPLLFILFSIIYIQLAKIFEYQADYYAATHMDNPKGMITGNIKMRKANSKKLETNFIFKKLFVIAVPYEQRMKMAEKELKLRNVK